MAQFWSDFNANANAFSVCAELIWNFDFDSWVPWFPANRWVTSRADAAASEPRMAVLIPLHDQVVALMASPDVDATEKIQLQSARFELELSINQTLANWYHISTVDPNGYFWWPDGMQCLVDASAYIGAGYFVGADNYGPKVIQWMQEAVAGIPKQKAYYEALVANPPTPHVMIGSAAAAMSDVYFADTSAAFYESSYCTPGGLTPAEHAQCVSLAAQLSAVMIDFQTVWDGVWQDACDTYRPDSAPSAIDLDRYIEVYHAKFYYHTGVHPDMLHQTYEQLVQWTYGKLAEGEAAFDASPYKPIYGDSLTFLQEAFGNTADTELYTCGDEAAINRFVADQMVRVDRTAALGDEFPRRGSDIPYPRITFGGGRGGFYVGPAKLTKYDTWPAPGYFSVTASEETNATVCEIHNPGANMPSCWCSSTGPGAIPHEWAGHAYQVPMLLAQQCGADGAIVFPYPFGEGFAVYAEEIIKADPEYATTIPLAWNMQAVLETGYITITGHVLDYWATWYKNVTMDECIQAQMDSVYGQGNFARAQGRCWRIIGSFGHQQATYTLGDIYIKQGRALAESLVPSDKWDPKAYNVFVMKVSSAVGGDTFLDMIPSWAAFVSQPVEVARAYPYYKIMAEIAFSNDNGVWARGYDPHNACQRESFGGAMAKRGIDTSARRATTGVRHLMPSV